MASAGGVHSQTLRGITQTKLDELFKKRDSFNKQRDKITAAIQQETNAIKRLDILAKGLKTCFAVSIANGRVVRGKSNNPRLGIDLRNLDRFLAQARYDPSVSLDILQQWQQTLVRHLEVQALKYEYAALYGQLTTERLSENNKARLPSKDQDVDMDDFEHISGGKKLESRRNWEQIAFEESKVDSKAIDDMLHGLFESTPDDSKHLLKALEGLRKKVEDFERTLAEPDNFDYDSLQWTIKGLLASDLLDDEKREVLRDFLGNETILGEIADVLNMRLMALEDWSWSDEVLLEQRRQLNGTYNIYMQEDLLDAIFLQYIGVQWSVFWKGAFNSFRRSPGVWKSSRKPIPALDRKRRDFFLGPVSYRWSVDVQRRAHYRNGYFVSQLLDSLMQKKINEEGDEEADWEPQALSIQAAPTKRGRAKATARGAAPRKQLASRAQKVEPAEIVDYSDEEFNAEEAEDSAGQYKPKNEMDAKQKLLHLLSAETLMQTRLHGELTCFRSQIETLYPSLPHSTVGRVLSFFGLSQKWLRFFERFLKAPLRFKDDVAMKLRHRRTGTPGSHVLSEVFGEVVLFCLDFQINQQTGGEILWRMNDDFWFWSSSHALCEKAWSVIRRFAETTGLGINDARSGAVRIAREPGEHTSLTSLDVGKELPNGKIRWGMLYFNANAGRFEIDQEMVTKNIDELGRQLKNNTNSIFPWIQVWNSYAATFFTSNFGKPANCFGRQHVDSMLATHQHIQRQIFASSAGVEGLEPKGGGGSVLDFLKATIKQRFGIANIPDGYFYFPSELGGLEVRNPFIGLLQVRDAVYEKPSGLLDEFEEAEKEAYRSARETFYKGRLHRSTNAVLDPGFKPDNADKFISFEEYTKYREELHFGFRHELADVFATLLEIPEEESIETEDNGNVKLALNSLGGQSGLRGILPNWYSMEPYWKWVTQLYGPEMIGVFGGLNIVDPGLLPIGMVSLFRSGRVSWQA